MNKTFLERSCKVIHKKVVDNWGTVPLSLYPFEEDYEDYYLDIYNFTYDYLLVEDEKHREEIFMFFIYNYNEGGDYSNTSTPNIDIESQFETERIIIAKFFDTTPFIVKKGEYPYFGSLPTYEIPDNDYYTYAVGNQYQMNDAVRSYVEDKWNVDEEWDVVSTIGVEDFLSFCYVSDTDKRIIANEEAEYFIEMADDEIIIDYLGENRDYRESREIIEKIESEPDEDQIELLISRAYEIVRNIVYNDTYSILDDYDELKVFLYEHSYIKKDKQDYYSISKEQFSDFPVWVQFDWDSFLDYEAEHTEYHQLSSNDRYDTFKYNGDIYFILRVE